MAFTIIRDDLARIEADAIVVPANQHLAITGGTVAAVAKAAGFGRMQRACNRLGGCPTGQAVATPGFRLHAAHVIHAVGPVWEGGQAGEAQLLRSAYDNALRLALRLNAESVAMPLLSTGSFGYPVRPAFEIAVEAIRAFLEEADLDVILVVYDRRAVEEGSRLFGKIAEYIDDAQVAAGHHGRANLEATGSFAPVRFCPRCGAPWREEARFCRHCGFEERAKSALDLGAPWAGKPLDALEAPSASFGGPEPDAFLHAAQDAAPMYGAAAEVAPEPLPAKRRPALHLPHLPTLAPRAQDAAPAAATQQAAQPKPSLGDLLANMDESFSEMLLQLIDASGMTDAQVYKRANITRQHFSKMRKPGYRPKKTTVLALAVALRLPLDETNELLARAGYALSHSSKFDIIVEYFIMTGNYDIFAINEQLFAYDQQLLG